MTILAGWEGVHWIHKSYYQEALDRITTTKNRVYAQDAAADLKGEIPSPRQIWNGTKHKDFGRSIHFFLWMLLHDGYKTGDDWTKIPGHEEKATCTRCYVIEFMNHILLGV
ncbi:hypothetical protein B0H11DRAFT_1748753 [Mycena galericulata]|nr:hypothetical protein B0H11DRAFT_1748753 [Mycena galericulata]